MPVSSASKRVLLKNITSSLRPARRGCLGRPFHKSADATTLVSNTNRISYGWFDPTPPAIDLLRRRFVFSISFQCAWIRREEAESLTHLPMHGRRSPGRTERVQGPRCGRRVVPKTGISPSNKIM